MFGLSRNMYQISKFYIGKVMLEVPGQIQILPPQPKRKRRLVRLFSFCLWSVWSNDLRRRSLELRAPAACGGCREPSISAAVEKPEDQREPERFFGHRKADQLLPPQPHCPPGKDIGRTNLRAARLLRFFYVQNSSAEKKISEGVGMDLNYRPPALQAGFAMFFADPAFFCGPDLLNVCVQRGFP